MRSITSSASGVDMEPPAEKKALVFFGSLEEQERARLEAGKAVDGSLSAAVQEGIKAGNINIPGARFGFFSRATGVRYLCDL